MRPARTTNPLGATDLAVTDLMLAGATRRAGVSASGAAALVVLRASPGLGVTELGRRIGLSQSATVRMVDALAGLVRRETTGRRTMSLHLTEQGAEAAALLEARAEPLTDLVVDLGERDRETLARLLSTLLARLYDRVGSTELLCRLRDRARCTTGAACPVGAASRR